MGKKGAPGRGMEQSPVFKEINKLEKPDVKWNKREW